MIWAIYKKQKHVYDLVWTWDLWVTRTSCHYAIEPIEQLVPRIWLSVKCRSWSKFSAPKNTVVFLTPDRTKATKSNYFSFGFKRWSSEMKWHSIHLSSSSFFLLYHILMFDMCEWVCVCIHTCEREWACVYMCVWCSVLGVRVCQWVRLWVG